MSLRVFLTGASGYVGSVLAERLARLPEVEAITGIGLAAPRDPIPPKMSFKLMDIRSPGLAAAMAGHDAVIHTACVVLWRAKMPVKERDDINFNGVGNVARSALASGVRRFIHASSMAAYDPRLAGGQTGVEEDFPLGRGDSPFYYWNSKAAAEKTLTEILGGTGVALTLFRPIYIMGPRNKSVARSYRSTAVNLLGYNPRRQFVHEADVAEAFVRALLTDMPGAFNIVPDDAIRLSDVLEDRRGQVRPYHSGRAGPGHHSVSMALPGLPHPPLLGSGYAGGLHREQCQAQSDRVEAAIWQRGNSAFGIMRMCQCCCDLGLAIEA